MSTEGIQGFYLETRDYAATASFWASLGFTAAFETDHDSGQWEHPSGGPYLFISQHADGELATHPILGVADSTMFAPDPPPEIERHFEPQHWNVVEAILRDPDGRSVSLHAPVPDGVVAPDAEAHHHEKYSTPDP